MAVTEGGQSLLTTFSFLQSVDALRKSHVTGFVTPLGSEFQLPREFAKTQTASQRHNWLFRLLLSITLAYKLQRYPTL